MERNKRIPITRLNRFYTEKDFNLDLSIAKEIIEGDINVTVVLYRIDRINTNSDDIYGESNKNEVRFLSPVELKVITNLLPANNTDTYNSNGSLRYQQYGNLDFYILNQQLIEKKIEISYGDIVGYSDTEDNLKYFEVYNNNQIISDNKHTMYGYKGYYKLIQCVPTDSNQFNGI